MENLISNAQNHSQYLSRWFEAQPDWRVWVEKRYEIPLDSAQIRQVFDEVFPIDGDQLIEEALLMSKLREVRQKVMLWSAARDLNNLAPLSEVTEAMTCLAEQAIEKAMRYLVKDLSKSHGLPYMPDGQFMPLWVVGMGKLGGRELNVSSDIDLIFVYFDDGETRDGPKSISHHEWFARLGKRLIKVLSDLTADGFVFRVDMRLRPNGDSGPLVCSLNMLEEYLMVQGREWERYAWIKGRLVYPLDQAGTEGLPPAFQSIVRPFVFRRYLDFGVIGAIRELHSQIRREANIRASNFPDRAADIKLGRGGIREIEFLAQMFQLVRGGQEPRLRDRPTLKILKLLVQLGVMDQQSSQDLQDAYTFFRKVEHRVQWWDDAQIHYLPIEEQAQQRIAIGLGYKDRDEFYVELKKHQDIVASSFASAFVLDGNGDEVFNVGGWSPDVQQYPNLTQRWESLREGSRYRSMSDPSRKNLVQILQRAIDAHPKGGEESLIGLLSFLETISRRSSYLALLTEYPHALGRVLQLLDSSKWGSQYLIRHPHLLDEMLVTRDRITPEEDPQEYWQGWRENLKRRLDDVANQTNHQELMMDVLREAHHAEIFQILLADLGIGRERALSVEFISDRLSALADVILEEALSRIWGELAIKYGFNSDFSNSGFGVIAYGKLGGKELGYGSDLDLVFIYDEKLSPIEFDAMSERYATVVRRLVMWLTSATSSGILFEIDTRLRPNGSAGLMVSNINSFEIYQLREGDNSAWVWEHQALTRARFCAGDKRLGDAFEKIRAHVLSQKRDENELRKDIFAMRQKIHEGHPNASQDYDLKHDSGGMVDIEFMVQFLVLSHSYHYPQLLGNVGNIALLQMAGEVQLIPKDLAQDVANAYRLLRHGQHRLRLDGADRSRIPLAQMDDALIQARASVQKLWMQLMRG